MGPGKRKIYCPRSEDKKVRSEERGGRLNAGRDHTERDTVLSKSYSRCTSRAKLSGGKKE